MALQANTGLRNDLLLAITIVMITGKTSEDCDDYVILKKKAVIKQGGDECNVHYKMIFWLIPRHLGRKLVSFLGRPIRYLNWTILIKVENIPDIQISRLDNFVKCIAEWGIHN